MILSVMKNTNSSVKFWFIVCTMLRLPNTMLMYRRTFYRLHSWFVASCQHSEVVLIVGVSAQNGGRVRLSIRICDVQMASLVESSDGETKNHLGLQDSVLGCLVPYGS